MFIYFPIALKYRKKIRMYMYLYIFNNIEKQQRVCPHTEHQQQKQQSAFAENHIAWKAHDLCLYVFVFIYTIIIHGVLTSIQRIRLLSCYVGRLCATCWALWMVMTPIIFSAFHFSWQRCAQCIFIFAEYKTVCIQLPIGATVNRKQLQFFYMLFPQWRASWVICIIVYIYAQMLCAHRASVLFYGNAPAAAFHTLTDDTRIKQIVGIYTHRRTL